MRAPADRPARPHANNFNFLRLLFASLVLVAHAPELVDGNRSRELITVLFGNPSFSLGTLAVYGFFFISGYLILQSWIKTPNLVSFAKKRALRIVPGFWVASLASALIVAPLGAASFGEYFSQFSIKAYISSLAVLKEPSVPATFAGQPYPFVNGSMWTIQYEVLCYGAVALAGTIGLARRRRMFAGFTAALIAAALSLRAFPVPVPSTRLTNLLPIDLQKTSVLLVIFAIGGCFLLFGHRIRYTRARTAAAALVLLTGLWFPAATELCLATGGAYLLFSVAFARIPAFAWFNSKPDISYGVYLYGWPVQKLLHWYLPQLGPWTLLAATLPICAACGWASWQWIERPFIRLKKVPMLPETTPPEEPVPVSQS